MNKSIVKKKSISTSFCFSRFIDTHSLEKTNIYIDINTETPQMNLISVCVFEIDFYRESFPEIFLSSLFVRIINLISGKSKPEISHKPYREK